MKRLERELSDLLRELDAVYAQLEVAYRDSEEASGIPYIRRLRLVRENGFDDAPECEKNNIIPLRPQ